MDFQYYPTSERLAARMWSKFKRPIGTVCDPSAGEGHLLRYAREGFKGLAGKDIPWESVEDGPWRESARFKFRDAVREFLAVEIDPVHHANLRELGGEVLGYDFMQVESLATVGQVIMNPPFAFGAEHVLHAWKCVCDAEIVAVMNAETVRNPYTAERKRLVDLIRDHGSVEYLAGEFAGADAERNTDVEVALIYLEKVPGGAFDIGEIVSGLKKGDEAMGADLDPALSKALALPANAIENVYWRFRAAVDAARRSALAESAAEWTSAQLGMNLAEMQASGTAADTRAAKESLRAASNRKFRAAYKKLKRQAWAQVIRSTAVVEKLSTQAQRKVESEAEALYELEFSVANIHGFLAGLLESMGDIYSDMVCGLFDTIIGRSTDNVVFYRTWQSNERHRFGMRVRRTRFIIPGFSVVYSGRLDWSSLQFLGDIDKVFGYLNGISGPYDGLVAAFERGAHEGSARVSTRFFDYRFYKGAGTMHFYPRSEEVVERLNRYVGARRQWLPGDLQEANADFRRQYEEAEGLTARYRAAWGKTRRSVWSDPVYAASREDKESRGVCEEMAEAIESVHAALGLKCGPAIGAKPALKAIGCDPAVVAKPEKEEQQEELLLRA